MIPVPILLREPRELRFVPCRSVGERDAKGGASKCGGMMTIGQSLPVQLWCRTDILENRILQDYTRNVLDIAGATTAPTIADIGHY